VRDEQARRVLQAELTVPGELSLDQLGSGDFTLAFSASGVSCAVTVNRELVRASPSGQTLPPATQR
jgi:hypothetical protein